LIINTFLSLKIQYLCRTRLDMHIDIRGDVKC